MPAVDHLRHLLTLSLLAPLACRAQPAAPPPESDDPGAPTVVAAQADASLPSPPDPMDLEPGTVRAFGLLMPLGVVERLSNDDTRGYSITAPMPRVMRYLERRLEIRNAEIHPLGALLRGAHLRAATAGDNLTLDVGVRGEGDQTLITVWNRTSQPLPPRSPEEGFRAAGFDPRTGQPLPQNNY